MTNQDLIKYEVFFRRCDEGNVLAPMIFEANDDFEALQFVIIKCIDQELQVWRELKRDHLTKKK